jgi:hypothetical protein
MSDRPIHPSPRGLAGVVGQAAVGPRSRGGAGRTLGSRAAAAFCATGLQVLLCRVSDGAYPGDIHWD